MNDLSSRSLAWSLAGLLMAAAGSAPADDSPRKIVRSSFQQGAPGGAGAGSSAAPPKDGESTPPAASPGAGASRNPFHAHTSEMLRQSNRLKSKGFSGNIMDDGELRLKLVAAIKLLSKPDQDYRGHRTKAIQQIDAAIRQLNTKAAKSVAGVATAPKAGQSAGSTKVSLTQEQSDDHLRMAEKSIEKILAYMGSDGNARRHAPVRASLQKAAEELKFALEGR